LRYRAQHIDADYKWVVEWAKSRIADQLEQLAKEGKGSSVSALMMHNLGWNPPAIQQEINQRTSVRHEPLSPNIAAAKVQAMIERMQAKNITPIEHDPMPAELVKDEDDDGSDMSWV